MPPGRQPDGSPRRKTVTRPTAIEPAFQAGRSVANPRLPANRRRAFDPHALLATIAEGRKVLRFAKKQRIFAQGDKVDAVFYIQTGKVRLTVARRPARKQQSAYLGDREFFGEGSIAGQVFRMGSATA